MNPSSSQSSAMQLDEPALRKLSRSQLQKIAKEHKVKANMKSDSIIKELVKLRDVLPPDQNEPIKTPPKKKRKTEQSPSVPPRTTSSDCPAVPIVAPPEISRSPQENRTAHPAAGDVDCDSASDLSYVSKQDYYRSPVSSRAGTPPLEEPPMLKRAVAIMNQITAEDQRIADEIVSLRNRAAALRQQAKKVRDVVHAEQGRRVRLEAFFTYWREIAPKWPNEWIYQEGDPERMAGS